MRSRPQLTKTAIAPNSASLAAAFLRAAARGTVVRFRDAVILPLGFAGMASVVAVTVEGFRLL